MITSFNLVAHLRRARDFSFATFGPPRSPPEGSPSSGVRDHLAKELKEVNETPNDVEEWADIAILAFDGALREGYTPEQIVEALVFKQTKNEHRTWPDWRTAEPGKAIEHRREFDDLTGISSHG